jgi:hypothetical protein
MAMCGNEGRSLPEKRSASQVERWLRRVRIIVFLLVLALLAAGAMLLRFQSESHFPLGITYEPWEVGDPGPPKIVGLPKVEPLRFEVLEEGAGPAAGVGDLIQVSLRWSGDPPEKEEDWWIWIGFRMQDHFVDHRLLAVFIGQREGGALRFTESRMDSRSAGHVYLIPFWNHRQYAWRKGVEARERSIYALGRGRYTLVRIKKIFKGQLRYRGIHLRDDNWIHRSPFWGLEKAPARHIGLLEARFDGVSADGRRATFQYGPWFGSEESWFWIRIPSDVLGAEDYRRMEHWIAEAWDRLPVGVQVE